MKRREKQQPTRSQRRRINRLRLFVVLAAVDVLLVIGILLMLPGALRTVDDGSESNAWFGVKSITVTGNTRYEESAVLGISGIREGQSVFSVSERTAEQYIRDTFSYVKDVTVDVTMSGEVTIAITEYEELGALYAGDSWMVVSTEGVGLMKMPVESDRPLRRVYLKGVETLSTEVGKTVLGGKDLEIVTTLVKSMRANGLTGVGVIDLSDRSNIRLNWKNQIDIALGNDSNLNYEIAAAVSAIPRVLSRHGETATGLLNLSQYSDEKIESPVVVFTPTELLDKEEPEVPEEGGENGENGDQTDADTDAETP